ncbi:hypothetical protein ACWF94_03775 [Streptomyces sp. NPDC055078]
MTGPTRRPVTPERGTTPTPRLSGDPEPGNPPGGESPARDRRALRAVARWSAALLVCAGLGAGTAYGVVSQERTDIPGLGTEDDGRWEYPRLSLPALPQGSPHPFAEENTDQIHHADLRRLLLPAPGGSRADGRLNGGWTTVRRFAAEFAPENRAAVALALDDASVRHIAARGWTMPDGTASRVYLLRFESEQTAEFFLAGELAAGVTAGLPLHRTTEFEPDPEWGNGGSDSVSAYVFREIAPAGGHETRQAYIVAGDTLALVIHSREGGRVAAVPFHQTVVLQSQLLS